MPSGSIISMFTAQTFRGQHEETAENRAFIKINGEYIAGADEFCEELSKMSVDGVPEWGIDPLTLPITYGRYARDEAKAYNLMREKIGDRFDYIYRCKGDGFGSRMKQIGESFKEVQVELQDQGAKMYN